MKVGDMVGSCYHAIHGIVIEAGNKHDGKQHGLAVRVMWCDGDESIEWIKFLRLISESR